MSSVRHFGIDSLTKIMEAALIKLPAVARRSFSVPSFSSKAQLSAILYDMSTSSSPLPEIVSPTASSVPIKHSISFASPLPAPGAAPPGMTSPSSLRRGN